MGNVLHSIYWCFHVYIAFMFSAGKGGANLNYFIYLMVAC